MASYKGKNIDFIVATDEDDEGALSRVSAISSSFPMARIIVVDSSGDAHKSQSRLRETISLLGKKAQYVDCNRHCRYTCYQKALDCLQGDYVAFRTDNGMIDEALTALGFGEGFEEDILITHPAIRVTAENQDTPAENIEAMLFKRAFVEQTEAFANPESFDEKSFITKALRAANWRMEPSFRAA